MVEWNVYDRGFFHSNRLGSKASVTAWLRGDDLLPVEGNYRPSWVGINARQPRPPVAEFPVEIRVEYGWRDSDGWYPFGVYVKGATGRSSELTVRVDPEHAATPEWVRRFVESESPTDRPGSWIGFVPGERMWRSES